MNTASAIAAFRCRFDKEGTKKRAEGEKAYLKSDLDFYGVPSAGIRSAARDFQRDHPDLSREHLLKLVRALWRTHHFELWALGTRLLERYINRLQAGDMAFIEKLIRQSKTWALVDWLAVGIAGDLVERYASSKRVLSRWAKDEDFWVRRAAMLALLRPLRRGDGEWTLFTRFASSMVQEKEFFIRKAIGWVLREISKKRPTLVYAFLRDHVSEVSGLTFREGSKYLPSEMKRRLVAERSQGLGVQ